jgi:two-component system, NarL family, response regulator DegU
MKPNLKVYIADDHSVVRIGMVRLLKTFKRVKTIMEAGNGAELIDLVKVSEPDVIILDVEMPVLSGYDAARYILERYKHVKILILTMHTENVIVERLIKAGVHGILSKRSSPDEVEKALYAIADHGFYESDLMEKFTSSAAAFANVKPEGSRLTSREIEVLLLICQELSSGEIGERLQISEKTFFSHRANLMAKTGARTNIGLVKYAHENGIFLLKKQK